MPSRRYKLRIEKAKIADAPQIHKLINHFASQGEMLARALSEIYENIRDFFVARDDGDIIACVVLHVIWADLAEIRSLAVDEEQQDQGIGASLAQACLDEARELGIPTVFCLTYKPAFFAKLGFQEIDKAGLPQKIWADCYRCPKFPNCDETAMVLYLEPVTPQPNQDRKSQESKLTAERTLSTERIYEGRVVNLRVDTVELPEGRVTKREIVEHSESVAVVAVDSENRVLLVRQFRKPVTGMLLEIPAGMIELGETPDYCARRELQEETGYLAQKLERLTSFYSSPGFCTEFLHLFLATDLLLNPLRADSDESIELIRIPLDDIPRLIASGEIKDAKSIAGLLAVIQQRRRAPD